MSSTPLNDVKNITASSSKIIDANKERLYLAVVNNGANDVTLSLGATAVDKKGIYLKANGGSWEMPKGQEFYGEIYAICGSGLTSSVSITEISQSNIGSRGLPI